MFRGSYRRRSAITWSVWGGAFLVLSLFLAWRLEWLPGGGGNSPVEDESPAENSVANNDSEKPADDEQGPELVDQSVFNQQGEPGDGFSEPARFRGGADAKPISPLPNGTKTAGNTTSPGFLTDYTPRGKGVRPAGFRSPQKSSAAPSAMLLSQIDRLIQQGEFLAAHKLLSEIYWNQPQWRRAIKTRIEMTAEEIYFRKQYHAMNPYQVKFGDRLQTIARKYGVHWHYLARLNELRITKSQSGQETVNIQPGQKLKVIKGYDFRKKRPLFGVTVDLTNRELTLYHDKFYVRKYRVGIGRDKRTPIGNFTVKEKVIDPPYTGTDERTGRRFTIEGKDPRNPLGSHWISIGNSYGIHGTIDPSSIGKAQSKGCIRMLNTDVKEIFGFVSAGSHVEIVR